MEPRLSDVNAELREQIACVIAKDVGCDLGYSQEFVRCIREIHNCGCAKRADAILALIAKGDTPAPKHAPNCGYWLDLNCWCGLDRIKELEDEAVDQEPDIIKRQEAVAVWSTRAEAAEANQRTPGTVEVCRMLGCECKHQYQWADCPAANCPISAERERYDYN